MELGLKGRKAFVAGSSSGIGRAIAAGLLAEGALVVVNGRKAEKLERTRAELAEAHGPNVHAVAADVSKSDEAARAIKEAVAAPGGAGGAGDQPGGAPAGA